MALRDLLRLRWLGRRRPEEQRVLSEDDVQRLQRVQRTVTTSVRARPRDQ